MDKRYLIIPTDDRKQSKTYLIKDKNGKLLYDFTAAIELKTPAVDAYMDVTRFGDAKLTVSDEEGNVIELKEDNKFPEINDVRGGKFLRPKIHFTPRIGWMNDPNGMVYMNGEYHFFFQHNPYSRNWGNMTWGHAVSNDLFHWEELGDAIFPDENGTIFSGSAVCDKEGIAGFGKDAMICYFTYAGSSSVMSKDKYFTQAIAYSNDNGRTFVKYDKNPIIKWIAGGNRDPKVEWCEELGKYVLALYLDGPDFRIFTSDDLVNWTPWKDIKMEGDNECPAFYPLEIGGERKWVFQGAHDHYVIGSIKNGAYEIEQEELPYHIGNISYAPQAFYGTLPRIIRIAWIQSNVEGTVFNSQAGIPVEFFLKKAGDKIRLGSLPVKETEAIVKRRLLGLKIKGAEKVDFVDSNSLRESGIDVSVKINEGCGKFTISCFGTQIKVDPENNSYTHGDVTAPLSYDGEKNIRVIFDTLSAEVFADGGLVYSTYKSIADRRKNVEIIPDGEVDVEMDVKVLEL